ncbi:MAG TPA: ATP-binding protein [Verrucomicrobiae bacterium]|nr:ATP-binding protein [Verrucomicrobiae bacterium]
MNPAPIKVLLVEDNPGDARLLKEELADAGGAGFEVTHAVRLSAALERLQRERFSIILLDLSLPDGRGLETLFSVQEHASNLPIVVLTGMESEELAAEALRKGAQDYLVKGTVDSDLLVRSIRYAIERQRADEELQANLRRLKALQEIERAISTLDLHTVLDVLLQKLDILLPYSATTVRLFSKASGMLEPIACRNVPEEEWKAERWRGGRGIPNIVFESKSAWTSVNVQSDPRVRDREFFRRHGLVSYLGLPLIAKNEVLGVISFYTKQEHVFSDAEVEFLSTLADQAAIAIQNSQLYEEIRNSRDAMEQANKIKEEFLSVMSHELRTPLNAILGYTEMVRDGMQGPVNDEQERCLKKVVSRARELLTMINGILQVTSMEAPRSRGESYPVNLSEFFEELRSAYVFPSNQEVTLHWRYDELPMFETDPERLRHILQNLINNAVKFTPKGDVVVSARHLSERHRMEFKVSDTGIGIPQEKMPIIFEKFRQVDSSETRSYGGVGLGLYIVKQYVEGLGGMIEVDSTVGKGSTFTVTLPFVSEALSAAGNGTSA